MRYPAYAELKESGVGWLGHIPEHWTVHRLKWSVTGCYNGVWGNEPDGIDDVVCIRVADFNRDNFLVDSGELTIRAIEPDQLRSRKLTNGDLLIEKSGGGEKQLVGCVVYFNHNFDAVCSNFVARMPVAPGHFARYWCYVHAGLYAGRLNHPAIKQTTGIQNLDVGQYFETLVAYPPLEEQVGIANFLDWKMGQIDALVSKKKELVKALKEKRIAVITQTVTKGLNPAAQIQESGIDWLGRVPRHWNIIPLGFLMTMSGGMTPSTSNAEYWEGDIPWVTPKDMKQERISDSIDHITEKALEETGLAIIPVGAVLVVVRGMILAHSFPVAITERPVTVNQDMKALRCGGELDASFLFWCLTGFSKILSSLAQESAHGTLKVESDTIKKFAFPVPPITEQREIVRLLESRLDHLDRLAEATENTIANLTEYRTALITTATSGQIDVRGMVKPVA